MTSKILSLEKRCELMMTRSARQLLSTSHRTGVLLFLCGVWLACGTTQAEDLQCDVPASHDDCAVIISHRSTAADNWKQVASAVRTFHRDAGVTHHVFEERPLELKGILAEEHLRDLALMGAPDELNRALFLDLYRLCRGRATQHDWRVDDDFKAGAFKVADGRLVGVTLDGERLPVDSGNPKVWLAVGNCLLGGIDGRDSMALTLRLSGFFHNG